MAKKGYIFTLEELVFFISANAAFVGAVRGFNDGLERQLPPELEHLRSGIKETSESAEAVYKRMTELFLEGIEKRETLLDDNWKAE